MKIRVFILPLFFFAWAAPLGFAQLVAPVLPDKPALFPSDPPVNESSSVNRRDRHFVINTLKIYHNETVIARLVAERAITREVGALARQLAADLDAATGELRALARDKHIILPEPRSKAGDLKKWNEKDPKTIDADYIDRVKKVLDDLANRYEKAAKTSRDPSIVAFAEKLLPAVREQRQRADRTSPSPAPEPAAKTNQ